jgi:SNF2 family DNA or RNA helicase
MEAMWPHQKAAHGWALDRRESLLSMGMGSGKTRVVIELLRSWQPRRVLVCCPKSVIPAWLKQVTMWGLDTRVLLLNGGTSAKKTSQLIHALADTTPLIVVVNYESAWRLLLIEATKWDVLVYDEIHRLKSHSGKASRWAARMGSKNPTCKRLGLSGTLLSQSILDAHGPWRAVESPECQTFGPSFVRFRAHFSYTHPQMPGMVLRWLNVEEFSEKFNKTTFQVNTTDVISLPEKIHETIDVVLSAKEASLYLGLEQDFIAECDDGRVTVANALVKLLRLQQITGGYVRYDETAAATQIDDSPSKRQAISDMLEDTDEPLVFFCRFRSDIDNCIAACKAAKRPYSELSGRVNDLEQWQSGVSSVLIAQIQSGGVGIDLTRSRVCCFVSLGYSLAEYEQAKARLHRPGQTKTTLFYHLVARLPLGGKTVDGRVYEALKDRKDVIDGVIEGYKRLVESNA